MKIFIDEDSSCCEAEIHIRTGRMDGEIEAIISTLKLYNRVLTVKKDGQIFFVDASEAIYFESVDDRTIFYTSDGVYESDKRLFQIEESFRDTNLIRISRSVIVNLDHVRSIRPIPGGRLELTLDNENRVYVSRRHARTFKSRLDI